MKCAATVLSSAVVAALVLQCAQAREPAFAFPEQTHPFEILPTPPSADSSETREELAELHRLERSRTPSEIMRAVSDDQDETLSLYGSVMGSGFTPQALPITFAFATRVRGDEGANTEPAKKGFARVRPYNLDKSLKPVCKTKTIDDSYPSGHATSGYLLALMLIDLVPEKRDAILARADDYAHNRLVCGVHYPSDVRASRLVAYAMHASMTANPGYLHELQAARTELRTAMTLQLASK